MDLTREEVEDKPKEPKKDSKRPHDDEEDRDPLAPQPAAPQAGPIKRLRCLRLPTQSRTQLHVGDSDLGDRGAEDVVVRACAGCVLHKTIGSAHSPGLPLCTFKVACVCWRVRSLRCVYRLAAGALWCQQWCRRTSGCGGSRG